MDPSSPVCQSRRDSLSSNTVDNQISQQNEEENDNKSCLYCLHNTVIKICERWFISLGVIAILFIMIGFFKFTSDKHGETLVFTGVGFLVILSTFMASQHHRNQRLRDAAGQVLQRSNDPIYVVTFPADSASANQTQNTPFPSLVLPPEASMPFHPQWQTLPSPKPVANDPPPPYEDVDAPPPAYETLHLNTRPS